MDCVDPSSLSRRNLTAGLQPSPASFDLRYETEKWTDGIATTWRDYQDSFFKDGFDLAPRFT